MDETTIRSTLKAMLDDHDDSVAELAGDDVGDDSQLSSDAGEAITSAERNKAVLDSLADQRAQAAAALGRLDEGTYGTCASCGKQIPQARLTARPEAALCVSCQQELEHA